MRDQSSTPHWERWVLVYLLWQEVVLWYSGCYAILGAVALVLRLLNLQLGKWMPILFVSGVVVEFAITDRSLSVGYAFAWLSQICICAQLFWVPRKRLDVVSAVGACATLLAVLSSTSGFDPAEYQFIALVTMLQAFIFGLRGNREGAQLMTGRFGGVQWLWIVIILGSMLPVAAAIDAAVPSAQQFLIGVVEQGLRNTREGRGFVRVANLQSISRARQINPRAVALRVFAEREPGYLRGRSFEQFSGFSWESPTARRSPVEVLGIRPENSPPPRLPKADAMASFKLEDGDVDFSFPLRIENDVERGAMFFSPLNATWLQGVGRQIRYDEHGIVRTGIDHRRPYRFFVASRSVPDPLDASQQERLLQVPESAEELRGEASRICATSVTPRAKMRAVENYFQRNFEYSDELVEPFSRAGDSPLVPFVKRRLPAHCEYFASASVLILRMEGVPARLVIGYRVYEMNDDSEYYVARNRNAHAWAEAWDELTETWHIVESTPGYSNPESAGSLNRDSNASNASVESDADEDQLSGISRWFAWLQAQFRAIASWAIPLVSASLLLLVAILLVRQWRTRMRETRSDYLVSPESEKRIRDQQRELRQSLRWLRSHGIERAASESWWALAKRLEQQEVENADLQERFRKHSAFFRQYANLRYGMGD